MRILLVEDHPRLTGFIADRLHAEGFTVDAFGTGGDAALALETTPYSAVILDLGLPDTDGGDVLRALRARGDATPVLILTARDALADRLTGLNDGADDYLTKPFAMDELVARLRALLRRPGAALGVTLRGGNLVYDTISRETRVDDQVVFLSRRETAALEHLLRRLGRVMPKDVLEESLYGFQDAVGSNSVEVLIHRLRKKLIGAQATVQLHTVRGVGYMMAGTP